MAERKEERREKDIETQPSAIKSFVIGLAIFSVIFSPAMVLVGWQIKIWNYFDQPIVYSFPISCFLGVAIAVIPALIFMFLATKKKEEMIRFQIYIK